MIMFGSGNAFAVDSSGNPFRFAGLQEISVDFSFDMKELYGQKSFPIDVARAKGKIEGKISSAHFDLKQWNSGFFNEASLTTGHKILANNELGTIPTTPFQITVANSATFYQDLGVVFASTGLPLDKVASAPAAGQYSVSAGGVYTFNTADTTKQVAISYWYNNTTSGKSVQLTNQMMGSAPNFSLFLSDEYKGDRVSLELYSCVIPKLSMPFKNDDHMIPDLTFSAMANAAELIGRLTVLDV